MGEEIQLGDTAKDTITGFEGVVISAHEYLHGCRRLALQPKKLDKGKPVDQLVFDEPQLVLVKRGPRTPPPPTGGPRNEPARRDIPRR